MRGWLEVGQPRIDCKVSSLCQIVRKLPVGSTVHAIGREVGVTLSVAGADRVGG